MNELTSSQRKELSSLAHGINPVVQVGQSGLTEGVTAKVKASLAVHELIKVKFIDFKDEKQSITEELCNSCDAVLVRIIGNIAILYKPSENEKKRKYGIVPGLAE